MLSGIPAIDADAHVYEDPFLLTKRAPAALREALPQEYGRALGYRFGNQIAHSSRGRWKAFEADGWNGLRQYLEEVEGGGSHVRSARVVHHLFPGAATLADGTPWEQRYPERPEDYDGKWYSAEFTAGALARQGFDQAFLYPSLGLYLPCFDGMGRLGIECCRVYNDWLHEYCTVAPQILKPVALVCLHEPALAVDEVHRTHALGFKAICLSRIPDGRTSADADLEPFWAACTANRMLVSFHPVTSNIYLSDQPLERPLNPFEFFNCNMFAQHFANLLIAGVLERHPDLEIALLESGCGWLPSVLWRLDRMLYRARERNDLWAAEIPQLLAHIDPERLREHVRIPPTDYFRRQCYIACEAEPFIRAVADLIGEDRLVFQGDFPHPDHHPSYIDDFVGLVPAPLRRKILWDNPRRMYRQP
jgi:predicted TIM-barrel fold metal-dependent hydrolase